MRVYIKNMEMPTSCSTCRMLEGYHDDGICHAANRWLDDEDYWRWYQYPEGDIDDSKPSNCPLAPVPENGDLIEKHNVFKLISAFPEVDKLLTVEFMKALYNLPTVIPASEEGEG